MNSDIDNDTEKYKNHTMISGRPVDITRKIGRYFSLAKGMALQSPYGKIRHGAILVKGGSIISTSFNKDKFNSFGNRFRNQSCGHATHHAELGCVFGLPRAVTMGSDMYVCRINKHGEYRLSKPCAMCHEILKHVGVKRVYYTTNYGIIKMYKL